MQRYTYVLYLCYAYVLYLCYAYVLYLWYMCYAYDQVRCAVEHCSVLRNRYCTLSLMYATFAFQFNVFIETFYSKLNDYKHISYRRLSSSLIH